MDEFELIRQYFAPLSQGFDGSLGLHDDAAILPTLPGKDLVVTKDALSQGIHFFGTEPAHLLAQKALRVNLSDLAAMGAQPLAYFLAIMLPPHTDHSWVADFARGLAEDQQQYGIFLAGGDTIATRDMLSFSITAIGSVPRGQALRRSRAKPGDTVYMTGTLGDSALGLQLLQQPEKHSLPKEAYDYLTQRYFLPQPRLNAGHHLIGIAHAAMDISDGLVQDLGHICRTSSVAAVIEAEKLPLSSPVRTLLEQDGALIKRIAGGGDDYELLFTAPADKAMAVNMLASELSLPITAIGRISEGSGVTLTKDSKALSLGGGYNHFHK